MNHLYKGKAKYISAGASVLLFMTITLYGSVNSFQPNYFHSYLTTDTVPKKNVLEKIVPPKTPAEVKVAPKNELLDNATVVGDTLVPVVDTFHFKSSKDSLDA